MSALRLSLLIAAATVLALAPAKDCRAQAYGAEIIVDNNDLRWFEPVDLDLDGRINPDRRGIFFRFDKINWALTGERVEIGDPDAVVMSEQIYYQNPEGVIQALVDEYVLAGSSIAGIEDALNVTFARDAAGDVITVSTDILDDMGVVVATFEIPQVFVENLPAGGTQGTEAGPPPQYQVVNGIKDAVPDAEFAWGERYEFGYSDGERGWLIGILDGPEQTSQAVYGAGPGLPYISQSDTGFADIDPFAGSTPVDADQDGILDAPIAINDVFALGFGSVAVNFQAPDRYFEGFRDYVQNSFPIGTERGPIFYVGNVGSTQDEGLSDDLEDDVETGDIAALADDLNGNGNTFFLIGVDTDGDGELDELVATITDFGDLHNFNVFFDDVTVRNVLEMDGVELMATHELSTSHKLESGRRDYLQIAYGVRFLQMNDFFSWSGSGSVMGRTGADVDVENQIIGPQIAARWTRDRGRWDFSAEGRFAFGYNRVDMGLNGIIGEEFLPGAVNRPVNGRTTTTVVGRTEDDFSPIAELRLQARYKLSKAVAFTAGYTGKFIDNIRRGGLSQGYTLPELTLLDGKSDILINGLDMGFELRY